MVQFCTHLDIQISQIKIFFFLAKKIYKTSHTILLLLLRKSLARTLRFRRRDSPRMLPENQSNRRGRGLTVEPRVYIYRYNIPARLFLRLYFCRNSVPSCVCVRERLSEALTALWNKRKQEEWWCLAATGRSWDFFPPFLSAPLSENLLCWKLLHKNEKL